MSAEERIETVMPFDSTVLVARLNFQLLQLTLVRLASGEFWKKAENRMPVTVHLRKV
jgi:hypothetical protein